MEIRERKGREGAKGANERGGARNARERAKARNVCTRNLELGRGTFYSSL